jgi:hypothetical protein
MIKIHSIHIHSCPLRMIAFWHAWAEPTTRGVTTGESDARRLHSSQCLGKNRRVFAAFELFVPLLEALFASSAC